MATVPAPGPVSSSSESANSSSSDNTPAPASKVAETCDKMFCCRGPPCIDEAEPSDLERRKEEKLITDASKKPLQQPICVQQKKVPLQNEYKLNSARDQTRIRNMVNAQSAMYNPQIKHVTNVQKDIHIRLNGQLQRSATSVGPRHYSSSYKIIQVPRHHSAHIERRQCIPTKLVMTNANANAQKEHKSESHQRTSTPAFGNVRLSEEFSNLKDNESDNLSDQQRDALSELDDTLSKYHDFEDEGVDTPTIIADVLPPGQFEPFNMEEVFPSDSGVDSDEPSSSRSSSLSNGSKHGIISKRASTGSTKRKVNSVSFKLPEGHVDKPYEPMKPPQKPKPAPVIMATEQHGIIVTGSDMKVWHSGNNVYVENTQSRRNSNGPFKGSFMKKFYGKYGQTDIGTYGNQAKYLTPKILEKVTSFENLAPTVVSAPTHVRESQNRQQQFLSRRHTFR